MVAEIPTVPLFGSQNSDEYKEWYWKAKLQEKCTLFRGDLLDHASVMNCNNEIKSHADE